MAFSSWDDVFGNCTAATSTGKCPKPPLQYYDRRKKKMQKGDLCETHRQEGYEALKSYARKEITLSQLRQTTIRSWMFTSDDLAETFYRAGPVSSEQEWNDFCAWAADVAGLRILVENIQKIKYRKEMAAKRDSGNSDGTPRKSRKPDAPDPEAPPTVELVPEKASDEDVDKKADGNKLKPGEKSSQIPHSKA